MQNWTKSVKNKRFTTESLLKITDIVVKKFVKNGSINYNDFDDIKQSVIEKYLIKKERIESSFTGKSKVETYVSAVIYRMILEYLRSDKNRSKRFSDFEDNSKVFEKEKVINPEEQLIINNEKIYLKRVLLTFGKQRVKLILFVKFYFRLLILIRDLFNYVPENKTDEAMKILRKNENVKDKEIYIRLCEMQNLFEQKKVKPDAVRMFINKNIETIINRLNGEGKAYYTKECLQILFEM